MSLVRLRGTVLGGVAAGALALPMTGGCKGEGSESDVLGSEVIGPEGGTLQGGGLTLRVPARAVTSETTFEIRRGSESLAARDYAQRGITYALVPEGLVLKLPAALELDDPSEHPAVLFVQDGLTVAAEGSIAYINEVTFAARAEAGTPVVTLTEPTLAASPDANLEAYRDAVHAAFTLDDQASLPRLNVVLTLYDTEGVYTRPINGGRSEGDCGLQLENVSGGSLTGGCADSPLTAAIRVSSAELAFDAVPNLSGKLDTPVTVGLVAGGDELAHHLGFFSFDTSACFQETCSGRGTCVPVGNGGECQCNEGFGHRDGDPFTCACVPSCSGRACGGDGCGGSCGGCGPDAYCDDAQGVCVPDGGDDDAADDDTTANPETSTTAPADDEGTDTTGIDETTGGADESTGGTSG